MQHSNYLKSGNNTTSLWHPAGSLLQFCTIRTCSNSKTGLQTPKYVSNAILRLETNLMRLQTSMWVSTLNYWLRLSCFPSGLTPLTTWDDFQSTWEKTVTTKTFGFSPGLLLSMGYNQAKALIKQCVEDTEPQLDLARSSTFIASEPNRHFASSMAYLTNL